MVHLTDGTMLENHFSYTVQKYKENTYFLLDIFSYFKLFVSIKDTNPMYKVCHKNNYSYKDTYFLFHSCSLAHPQFKKQQNMIKKNYDNLDLFGHPVDKKSFLALSYV